MNDCRFGNGVQKPAYNPASSQIYFPRAPPIPPPPCPAPLLALLPLLLADEDPPPNPPLLRPARAELLAAVAPLPP
jgi:hypothetical protein